MEGSLAATLDGIRDEVREAVLEGDAQDCPSADCIADAVYEIVRVRLGEHQHEWTHSNIFPEDQVSHSPVSHMDSQVRTNQLMVRTCPCGNMERVLVSYGRWRWLNRRND